MAKCEWLSRKNRAEKKKELHQCAPHLVEKSRSGLHAHLPFVTLLVVDIPHSEFIQSFADVCDVCLTACMSAEVQRRKKNCSVYDRQIGKGQSHVAQQSSPLSSSKDFSSVKNSSYSFSSGSRSFFTWDSAATWVAWLRISNNLKWSHYCHRETPSCSRLRMTASANSSRPRTPCWRNWNCWNSGPRNWPPIDYHLKKTELVNNDRWRDDDFLMHKIRLIRKFVYETYNLLADYCHWS